MWINTTSAGALQALSAADSDPVAIGRWFLADRTNGRAIATLLRLSSVTLCIVAKRCVLEQKLLWGAYRKSYMKNRLVPK